MGLNQRLSDHFLNSIFGHCINHDWVLLVSILVLALVASILLIIFINQLDAQGVFSLSGSVSQSQEENCYKDSLVFSTKVLYIRARKILYCLSG